MKYLLQRKSRREGFLICFYCSRFAYDFACPDSCFRYVSRFTNPTQRPIAILYLRGINRVRKKTR
jgi:hypothetical protein